MQVRDTAGLPARGRHTHTSGEDSVAGLSFALLGFRSHVFSCRESPQGTAQIMGCTPHPTKNARERLGSVQCRRKLAGAWWLQQLWAGAENCCLQTTAHPKHSTTPPSWLLAFRWHSLQLFSFNSARWGAGKAQ